MNIYSHNWQVPNWQDKAAYPKADELTNNQWLWEFLRRRIDYRKDWLHYSKITEGDTAPYLAYCIGATKKYGLWGDCLLDPNLSAGELPDGEPNFTNTSGKTNDLDTGVVYPELTDTSVKYQFDLAKPIKQQLIEAKNILEGEREWRGIKDPGNRIHSLKYPRYLRVLDALNLSEDKRPTYAEIGRIVFEIDDPNDAASQAKKLSKQ